MPRGEAGGRPPRHGEADPLVGRDQAMPIVPGARLHHDFPLRVEEESGLGTHDGLQQPLEQAQVGHVSAGAP